MFFSFFKPKKVTSVNLYQLFDKHCSLPLYKIRSPETHELADLIKNNAMLNCDINQSNLAKLDKEALASDMDKITNVFNAIDNWYGRRKEVSERVDKIKIFRNNILKPYAMAILTKYQEKGGQFEERWKLGAVSNKTENASAKKSNNPILRYISNRCFSFVILPFISQIFDSLPDLLGLLN